MVIERLEPEKYGDRGPVYIHQAPCVEEILHRFKHQDCKTASTPSEAGVKLSKEQMPTTEEGKAEMAKVPYKQLVGALLYLCSCTRPDLAFAIGSCARYGSNPGPVHWRALKHILRYLSGTRRMGCLRQEIRRRHSPQLHPRIRGWRLGRRRRHPKIHNGIHLHVIRRAG